MLYIADVGQDKYEEINVVPMSAAGVNYGWSTMDGARWMDHRASRVPPV
jgi:hypothetical protein